MPGRSRGVIVFAVRQCGIDGQVKPGSFRVARTIASRGKSADDGEWYNPTLSCANDVFCYSERIGNRIRFCPRQGGDSRRKEIFYLDSL
jgi:hypothetical protein